MEKKQFERPDTSKWPRDPNYIPFLTDEEKAELLGIVERSKSGEKSAGLDALRLAARVHKRLGLEFGGLVITEFTRRGGHLLDMVIAARDHRTDPELDEFLTKTKQAIGLEV